MFARKMIKFMNPRQCLNATKIIKLSCPAVQSQQKRLKSDLYEPDYLISMEPDEPVYDCLNLQLKGYDFAVLEACQSQIHKYAEVMGIQVDESWATPAQQVKVQRFKPGGTAIDAEYHLNVYERNVQAIYRKTVRNFVPRSLVVSSLVPKFQLSSSKSQFFLFLGQNKTSSSLTQVLGTSDINSDEQCKKAS